MLVEIVSCFITDIRAYFLQIITHSLEKQIGVFVIELCQR